MNLSLPHCRQLPSAALALAILPAAILGLADSPAEASEAAAILPLDARQTPDAFESDVFTGRALSELWELCGLDARELRRFSDGRPLGAEDRELVWKVLYELPRLGRGRIEAALAPAPDWSEVARDPGAHRLRPFTLQGRIRFLERLELPAAAARCFGFREYFQAQVEIPGVTHPVLIYTRQVPQAWQGRDVLNERIGCSGLLLKSGDGRGPLSELLFAAERLAWFPERVDASLAVGESHVWLGELGWDVGLLDELRQSNQQSLLSGDREGFYQLLAVARRVTFEDCRRRGPGRFELRAVLQKPTAHQGRLLTFQGVARRIQRVLVDEPELQRRFGLEHYYEVDLVVPLGQLEIRLDDGPGEKAPVLRHSFPVVCCVPDLPATLSVGENLHVPLEVTGFFCKLWAYRSEALSGVDEQVRQTAPLFIAPAPLRLSATPSPYAIGATFAALAGAVVALGLSLSFVWRRYQNGPQRAARGPAGNGEGPV